jgi:Uncharacterized protein conserved in bacteria (DUF2252)
MATTTSQPTHPTMHAGATSPAVGPTPLDVAERVERGRTARAGAPRSAHGRRRQLRDWKGSVEVEEMVPTGMRVYAQLCSWTLARAHARTGDRIAIAAYLGSSQAFADAVADFAQVYADRNERDHAALLAAIAAGRVTAESGV